MQLSDEREKVFFLWKKEIKKLNFTLATIQPAKVKLREWIPLNFSPKWNSRMTSVELRNSRLYVLSRVPVRPQFASPP